MVVEGILRQRHGQHGVENLARFDGLDQGDEEPFSLARLAFHQGDGESVEHGFDIAAVLNRLDGRHHCRAHVGRMNMLVGQSHALDHRNKAPFTVEPAGLLVGGVNAGDGMNRPAVIVGRQLA